MNKQTKKVASENSWILFLDKIIVSCVVSFFPHALIFFNISYFISSL